MPGSAGHYEPRGARGDWGEGDGPRARPMDEGHVDHPGCGARKPARVLTDAHGVPTTRWRARGLMRRMGVGPASPKPSPSGPPRQPRRLPCLPRGKGVLFPSQAWSPGITCVRPGGRHMRLAAITGWHSRHVVGWGPSDTMRACEVVECARPAFARHGTPGVPNSDQGSVFGSEGYVSPLAGLGMPQGMDGRARWVDNVGIERWFRTPKGERPGNAECSTPRQLELEVAAFVEYHDGRRIHQALGYEVPASWYCGGFIGAAA